MTATIGHLHAIRAFELERARLHLPPGGRVLEIGGGTGHQAALLLAAGFDVVSIDVAASNYAGQRVFPVQDYDGRHLPVADASVDAVFSSNVLEHVLDLEGMHREIHRVLRPGGVVVHLMPTTAWRAWTTMTHSPGHARDTAALITASMAEQGRGLPWRLARGALRATHHAVIGAAPRRHGERGNVLTELWWFSAGWWRRNFEENGFVVRSAGPAGLFYTGHCLFDRSWSISSRSWWSTVLGSGSNIFVLAPA